MKESLIVTCFGKFLRKSSDLLGDVPVIHQFGLIDGFVMRDHIEAVDSQLLLEESEVIMEELTKGVKI